MILPMIRTPGAVEAWEAEEADRCREIETEFRRSRGLVELGNNATNIGRVLRSGGASPAAVRWMRARLDRLCIGSIGGGPFDHGRIFGKGRVPLVLVGFPYDLRDDDRELLHGLHDLGLDVEVNGPESSFYNESTLQVLVSAPGAARVAGTSDDFWEGLS